MSKLKILLKNDQETKWVELYFQEHQRYVQSVRYSPDGNFWASGGFDGRIFIYEAKDSELIGEFNDESVKGKYAMQKSFMHMDMLRNLKK